MHSAMTDSAAMRLTDIIRGQCAQTLEEILENIAADINLKHISYIRFVSHADRRVITTIVTYPIDWQNRYYEKQYLSVDPVVAHGCETVIPFDWDALRTDDPTIAAFFADAAAHDVGRNGISFPVRNRKGGFSLVSFTSDHTREDWTIYKNENLTTLHVMASLIDAAASFTKKTPAFPAKLSRKEKNCLVLFAKGRSEIDIADALGISVTEVRLYLDTARHKLCCISVTQAVAVAIATEAIPFDFHG